MRRTASIWVVLVVASILSVDDAGYSPERAERAGPMDTRHGYALPRGFLGLGTNGGSPYVAASGSGRILLEPGGVRFAGPFGVVGLRFMGASAGGPRGGTQLPGRINRLIGERSTWILDARRYGRVVYRSLYPGIDAVFRTRGDTIEYDFVLVPHADARLIRLRFSQRYESDASGKLVFGSSLVHEKPRSYQIIDGAKKWIPTRFIPMGAGDVGFRVGRYDRSQPLVIDPVISYSTYLGGSDGSDRAHGIAVDEAGNAYVTGVTFSNDFPTTDGAAQRSKGGDTDAFVASFRPDGRLRYATYLGGTPTPPYGFEGGVDDAFDIDVDKAGRAWITGATSSIDFPTKNAYQPQKPGGGSATFVAALNPDGSLHYSTYLGTDATGEGIAVHPDQSVVISGTGHAIPTINAFQPVKAGKGNGTTDAFVTKFSPTGDHLEWSTYIGGDSWEDGEDVAVDGVGNVFVVGTTDSANFPVTSGVFQKQWHGDYDAFVAKLSSTGSLVYATYLGGEAADVASAVDVDPQGRAVVGGGTHALDSGGVYGLYFPLRDPFDDYNDGLNGFITRMNHDGSGLVWSTYFGTTKLEIFGLAVDDLGGIHVAGITWTGNLPLKMPFHERPTDIYDAFVASFSRDGKYVFGTFLGGTPPVTGQVDEERANALAVHGKDLFVAGETMALDFPVVRAIQPHLAGVNDAFVSRLVPKRPVARHRMRMTMEMRGHIRFKVRLVAADGFTACQRRRRIVMQSSSSNGPWVRLGAPLTDAKGFYRGKYVDVFGRYRWIVDSALVKVRGKWHACLPAQSNARRHVH
jgi:beta-propeller repeat-containing protein